MSPALCARLCVWLSCTQSSCTFRQSDTLYCTSMHMHLASFLTTCSTKALQLQLLRTAPITNQHACHHYRCASGRLNIPPQTDGLTLVGRSVVPKTCGQQRALRSPRQHHSCDRLDLLAQTNNGATKTWGHRMSHLAFFAAVSDRQSSELL